MSDTSNPAPAPTPQDDAERIRLKRLAKLQSPSGSGALTPQPAATLSKNVAPSPSPAPLPPNPKPIPRPTPRASLRPTPPPVVARPLKRKAAVPLDLPVWEHQAVQDILKVTLSKEVAEESDHDIVWLKSLAQDLASENGNAPEKLSIELIDKLLISRLKLDPLEMRHVS
ncbi:hypothetical protein EST38_g1414 [Candolleomyces aberdarensis]|uniref:Uncharacterized protein n=1 Tax=Candolleomyces aberdarensis TaxID=2316362 RepID=A0A4Q2DUW9_9AGAR|nr:hypothetical protein EST38_g1414 [Candolleomyces aberdarensis]